MSFLTVVHKEMGVQFSCSELEAGSHPKNLCDFC